VAAFVPETERIGTPDTRQKLNVLVSRIRQLAPSDVYAATIMRAGGRAEIHCAFASEADATVFATAMKAKVVRRYPATPANVCFGWMMRLPWRCATR